MLFNKNNYRKAGEKKVLHKVGKEWKVVSVALLMAIAGGAVATHANANAASTNDQDNAQTNSLADYLNTPSAANQPRIAAKASSNTKSVAPSSASEGIHYYAGNNGSAASYFDKVTSDNSVASKNYSTVSAYVQSLNSEYNPQVHSFAMKSGSAKAAASNDSKLANSYSNTAKNSNVSGVVNSLAAKNNIVDPALYQGMVQGQEEAFSDAVSSASDDVQANSTVASLTNLLEGTNLSAASLSASATSAIASSNYVAAVANQKSVSARYGNGSTTAAQFIDVANRLSAGATTLYAVANGNTYAADMDQLDHAYDATSDAALNAAVTSAVNSAASSEKGKISNLASAAVKANNTNDVTFTALSEYAGTNDTTASFNDFVTSNQFSNDNLGYNGGNAEQSLFNEAISAAADTQVAPALQSTANSLYGKFNPQYANSAELSKEASNAEQSANDRVTAASNANAIANTNSTVVSNVSAAIGSNGSAGAASLINAYLGEGVTKFEENIGYLAHQGIRNGENSSAGYTFGPKVANGYDYVYALSSLASDAGVANAKAGDLVNSDVYTDFTTTTTTSDVYSALTGAAKLATSYASTLSTINANSIPTTKLNGSAENTLFASSQGSVVMSGNTTLSSILSAGISSATAAGSTSTKNTTKALSSAVSDTGNNALSANDISGTSSVAVSSVVSVLKSIAKELNVDASAASAVSPSVNGNDVLTNANGLGSVADNNWVENDNLDDDNQGSHLKAALLSDGVDLDTLDAESGAIANVYSAESDAIANSADVKNVNNSAQQLSDALSVAASSATSALNSAVNASANYSANNDEDVTLASYFASSYTSDANSESDVASSASSELNSFFINMAADSTFADADTAYANAVAAATNDYKLGVSNAQSVYNSLPHFLDVLKSARIHTTPNFGSKDDNVTGAVNKGDRLTVKGINVSRNNNWRGVTRYYVIDNTTGKKGFITAQPNFTKGAYLSATSDHANVEVKTLKPVQVYSEINGKKSIGTLPAGKVIEGADVVYDNADEDAHGFTKVETQSDDFFTANTDYVEIVVPTVNNNNNNNNSNYSFNLQNPDQKMGPYYNNYSQY